MTKKEPKYQVGTKVIVCQDLKTEIEKIKNAYTKDGMYCIYTEESIVYKYPMVNIFRVEETYN